MKTTETTPGWAYYDGDCGICSGSAVRHRRLFERLGFKVAPFQSPGVREKLGLSPDAPFTQMWLITPKGEILGGADALVHLSRKVWWGWPFFLVSQLPGAKPVYRVIYRWFAQRRHAFGLGGKP